MAFARGPKLNQAYLSNLKRASNDGGFFVRPKAQQIRSQIDQILSLNPSLTLVPTAGKAGKLYSMVPNDGTGDFTVSRNGTATYFGKDGLLKTAAANEPRLEFDRLTGQFNGVLVEPAATNYFSNNTYSNVDGAVNNNCIFTRKPSQGIFGLDSIEGVVQDTYVSGQIQLRYSINLPAGFYTHTFYVKKNCDFFRIEHLGSIQSNSSGVSQQQFWFNATTGLVINVSLGITTYDIQDYGDWWKVSYVIESTGGNAFFDYEPLYGIGNQFEFCGSQIEEGYVPTSFIPTSGSQVTRPADVITTTTPSNVTQATYTLDETEITESISGNTTYTLPTGSITNLYMI